MRHIVCVSVTWITIWRENDLCHKCLSLWHVSHWQTIVVQTTWYSLLWLISHKIYNVYMDTFMVFLWRCSHSRNICSSCHIIPIIVTYITLWNKCDSHHTRFVSMNHITLTTVCVSRHIIAYSYNMCAWGFKHITPTFTRRAIHTKTGRIQPNMQVDRCFVDMFLRVQHLRAISEFN